MIAARWDRRARLCAPSGTSLTGAISGANLISTPTCEESMKTYAAILFLAVPVLGVNAASVRTSESLEARTARRVQETPPTLKDRKANEIKKRKVSYSGVAVEAVKVHRPLELI